MRSGQPRAGSWQPILRDADAERALGRARALAASKELRAAPSGPSLARGAAGLALFHAYAAEAGVARRSGRAIARRLLRRAVAAVAAERLPVSLFFGLTGIAWAAEHLTRRLPLRGADANGEVDEALLEALATSPWPGHWELGAGLVGVGVYALERLPAAAGRPLLERVIERLGELAERGPAGATWRTRAEQLGSDELRAERPLGHYNLGMAHGIPGVIALLAEAVRARVAPAAPLLEDATRWLLAQKIDHPGSVFPSTVGPGITPEPARTAWCTGDLGIALALLGAARASGESSWEREALALARAAASRAPAAAQVTLATLCHGAGGMGHLCNRLFQATRDAFFAEKAREWLALALRLEAEDPTAGGRSGGIVWGRSGLGLALLAAATDIEPAWDRMLLVAVPPTG